MPHRPAVFPSCAPTGRQGLRLCVAGSCLALGVLLAGCASQSPGSDHAARALPGGALDDRDDPIAALLRSQDLKERKERARARPSGQDAPGRTGNLAEIAQDYLGVKYRWGGSSPDTGFDCSGLVSFVVEQSLGLRLPRNAAEIAQLGAKVDRNELQPGDLVFFNTLGRRYSHVGIYVGDNRFVHAPSSGGVVRVESMEMRYWTKRYNGARRLQPGMVAAG